MPNLPTYEVHACKYAHLPRKGHEVQIMADPHDADHPMDYFVWVAIPLGEDGKRLVGGQPIVIDTGFSEAVATQRGRQMLRSPALTLRDLGVEPNDVQDVVVTHLHYDHVGGWALFPSARYHVQDKEMQFATGRHMAKKAFRHAYEVEEVVAMVRHLYGDRVVFHDGEGEIAPGVTVHHIGGHTMGIQSVRVWTRNGWLVLASDAAHYYWGFEDDKLFAIVFNVADMLAGYDRLKKLADGRIDMVVPGHDARVMERYPPSSAALKGWSVRLD